MILSKRIYLSANETYTFQIIGGIVAIETDTVQNGGALITYSLYGVGVKVSNLLGDLYVEGDVSTSSKVACWRDASGCHIRNNWNSGFSFYYSTFSFKV